MTRHARKVCAAVLASAALLAAGCGDDDEENGGGTRTTATTEARALLPDDIPPRAAAPNIKGADAEMSEVATKFGTDAVGFFTAVFEQNQKPYREPSIVPAETPTETCGKPFDPQKQGYFLCFSEAGDRLTLGVPFLERVRNEYGDSGAVFLIGYGVALSAYDQLTGDRLAKGGKLDQQFAEFAVCLVGAWNRWMTKDRLLEPGDEEELLKVTADFLPGQTPEGVSLGQDVYAAGFTKGSRGCIEPEGSS